MPSGRRAGQYRAGVLVQRHQLVGARRRGVHPVPAGHDEHTVHLRYPGYHPDHPVGTHVDLDDRAGAEVRDEQQSARAVEAGVVEPGAVARQRQFTGGAQRQRHPGRIVASQHGHRDDRTGDGHRDGGQRHE